MAALFRDSFDYYNSVALKWTTANGAVIDLSGTLSRTGIGCLVLNNTTGSPQIGLPSRTGFTIGVAYRVSALNGGGNPIQLNAPGGRLFAIAINSDGSISLIDNQDVLATTTPGLIVANVYNYYELQAVGGSGLSTCEVRVNGVTVIHGVSGTNANPITIFTIQIPGGGVSAVADDVYVNDNTGTVNTGFLGPVRIGAVIPSSDGSPLSWAPSVAGPHFSLIDQVPQNGGSSYVSSFNVGDIDQYHFPLPSDVTPFATITDVQVSLLAEINSAGSRSVGVQQGTNPSAGEALTTDYHYVLQPYDINPTTGVAWEASDFPGTTFGPVVTA